MALTTQKLLKKAGIELMPGKNHPAPGSRGAAAWDKVVAEISNYLQVVNEEEIERADAFSALAAEKAKLAEEKAELIKKLASAQHMLSQREIAERLMVHGLSREDSKYLTSGEGADAA